MRISLFKNVSEVNNPESLDLIDHLFDIRDGKWEDLVTEVRKKQTKEEKDELKRKMPTVCFSGIFRKRADSELFNHSNIIAMDLDNVENLNQVKEAFKQDKYVISVFMSTGGNGLRVIFRINPEKHKLAFKSICQYIYNHYGQNCDFNSSVSKPYVVSFDPDLYINPDYAEVPVFNLYIKETVIKNIPVYIHNNDDFNNVYKQILGRRINICDSYEDWLKLGFGLAEEFREDGRHYFHELSKLSDKYKFSICDKQYDYCVKHTASGERVNIRTFYYLAKVNGINVSSERTKEIVRVTRNSKKAGLTKKQISNNLKEKGGIEGVDGLIEKIYDSNDKDHIEDDDESILATLELFINNSYNLKFNEISGFFEDSGIQVDPRAMNSIFISAKKIMPKLDYPLMIRLLKSDFIESYNPLFKFFGSDGIPIILPEIPDENQRVFKSPLIDKLSECIINDNEAFTRYFLRKWLVSVISSAHKVHSPLLLCLLGGQGTGKTEFLRRLMPKELQHYYAESKLDKEKDDEILMTENLIIMDDELGGKSKQDALKLKNITSKQWFSLRRPYGDHNEKILRLAVLCGTSNYKQVMSDPTGNRRVIPIEVFDIDKIKYNSIDKRELFMEMFKLYKEGFDWRVVQSDNKLLNKDEDKYSQVIKERELLLTYFDIPRDEDFGEKMSTTDIIVDIERLTGQKLNSMILGRELEDLGYIKKSTRLPENKNKVRALWSVEKINRKSDHQGEVTQYVSPYNQKKDDGKSSQEQMPF